MNVAHATMEGLRDLWSHRFRSLLTILGIILGVASLLTMLAITKGMATSFRESLNESGDLQKIRIQQDTPPREQAEMADISLGLTYRDVEAINKERFRVLWVSPFISQNMRLSYENNSDGTSVVGALTDHLYMDRHRIKEGRFLTQLDIDQKKRVVVLGDRVAMNLFGFNGPQLIGKQVKINDVLFTVVGTLPRYLTQNQQREVEQGITEKRAERNKSRGSRRREWDPFSWKHNLAVIPLTTMLSVFKSSNMVNGVDEGPDIKLTEIQVGLLRVEDAAEVQEWLRNTLRQTHRGIEDFQVVYDRERFAEVEQQIFAVRVSGGLIAGISLLVGGVGIMNIMLASITDRIREIGVRRAIGAQPVDIFIQILMEAVLLAMVGGVLGILAAQGMIYFLDAVVKIPNPPELEVGAMMISFMFALVIGVLAGIYPAIRASTLRPVEALKFE
jgi:putative ABC transport system permease protein